MIPKKIILVLLIIIAIGLINNSSSFTETNDNSSSSSSSSIDKNTVFIFYAPWCGHCKQSMPEFTKASENDNIRLINSDDPTAKRLLREYDISGFPTIMRSDHTPFRGNRTASEIIDFANDDNDD